MNSAVTLNKISKIYTHVTPHVHAISDISLIIHEGEFFCFVGPSGCGKSTVIKMIAGIETLSSGKISTNGTLSMVFQSGGLLPWLNVEQNVEFAGHMQELPKDEVYERSEKYLELVNLNHLRHKYPRELSGGQRQRVGLARALSVEPNILLLDEPFSALDPGTTDELHTYLLHIWQQTHTTIIMVSHIIDEAIFLSDRIAVMEVGKVKEIIDIKLPRPRNIQSQKFLTINEKLKKDFKL